MLTRCLCKRRDRRSLAGQMLLVRSRRLGGIDVRDRMQTIAKAEAVSGNAARLGRSAHAVPTHDAGTGRAGGASRAGVCDGAVRALASPGKE